MRTGGGMSAGGPLNGEMRSAGCGIISGDRPFILAVRMGGLPPDKLLSISAYLSRIISRYKLIAAGSGIGCPLGPRTYEFSNCGYTSRMLGECETRRNGELLDRFGLTPPGKDSSKCDGLV